MASVIMIQGEAIMATTPDNEEPGFENDVNELPEDQSDVSEDTLEDDGEDDLEAVQEDAAEEREEGGYQ
jgi:hypothetical protein